MKKILIVSPNGNSKEYEVDGFELSQGKYTNYDIVLMMLKNPEEIKEHIFETVPQPSKKGVLPSLEETSIPLKESLSEEIIKKFRDDVNVSFLDDSKSFISQGKEIITTSEYIMDDNNLLVALDDLVSSEVNIINEGYILKLIKEPIIKFTNDKFLIEEEVRYGVEVQAK